MDLPGISIHNDMDRAEALVEKWSNDSRPTAVRIVGGIGDALIVAQVLAHSKKHAHLYVRDNQMSLMHKVKGIDTVKPATSLNRAQVRRSYGGVLNCPMLFATARQITSKEYYKCTADYLQVNLPAKPVQSFESADNVYPSVGKYVCIHAGSSNPNRKLPEATWEEIAASVTAEGNFVWWLGTMGDFGMSGKRMACAWDTSNCLVDQMELVRKCSKFYGNDSGFAHIAGILGVRGDVFFVNTHPDQVVARYPNLCGHHAYLEGEVPSRSLKLDDPQAINVQARWTPEVVCKRLHLHRSHTLNGAPRTSEMTCTLRVPDVILAGLVDNNYAPVLSTSLTPQPPYLDYTDRLSLHTEHGTYEVSSQVNETIRAIREILLSN
tara:strand:+ start:9513 stop:10649 length:1137 start_codon:yes stop_codon:yes gene_type:complete